MIPKRGTTPDGHGNVFARINQAYEDGFRDGQASKPRVDDGRRPHKWPGNPPDGNPEVIAWKCAACDEWVSEYGPNYSEQQCTVDWRNGEATAE